MHACLACIPMTARCLFGCRILPSLQLVFGEVAWITLCHLGSQLRSAEPLSRRCTPECCDATHHLVEILVLVQIDRHKQVAIRHSQCSAACQKVIDVLHEKKGHLSAIDLPHSARPDLVYELT